MGIGKVSKGIEDVKKAVEKRGEKFNEENFKAPPLKATEGAQPRPFTQYPKIKTKQIQNYKNYL